MPAGAGARSRTRHLFARGFRQHGFIPLTTYLRTFKIGDYVDIKVNGAVHKVGSSACRMGISTIAACFGTGIFGVASMMEPYIHQVITY